MQKNNEHFASVLNIINLVHNKTGVKKNGFLIFRVDFLRTSAFGDLIIDSR